MNPPLPTGAARRGHNVPPPPGAIGSESLGSGISANDGQQSGEREIALDAEHNVVATLVEEDENKTKPPAAVVANRADTETAAPPQAPPQRHAFTAPPDFGLSSWLSL